VIPRLVGLDGNAKMSKSLNNAIYIKDNVDTIRQRVMTMYTDPNHISVDSPGTVEGNVVFMYLDLFDDDKSEVTKLKEHYKKGGLGDVALKNRLADILIAKLEPMRKKRSEYEQNMDAVYDIVKKGNEKAREKAAITLSEVRRSVGVNYFSAH